MSVGRLTELQKQIAQLETEIVRSRSAQEESAGLSLFAQDIVQTLREPLLVLDSQLRVLSANPAFYRVFETDPVVTEGVRLYEVGNHQWDIPRLRRLLEEVLPQHKAVEDFEVDHLFPGIGRRVMALNARQLDDVQMILVAIEDVTEKKLAMEELRHERNHLESKVEERTAELEQAVSSLEKLNVELDGYASSVSHDLRGSMAVIEGASMALRDLARLPESERLYSDIDEIAEIISSGVEKAELLMTDLLSLAVAGQAPAELAEVDIREVVQGVQGEVSERFKDRDIRFEVDDELGRLKANPTHIYQLFWNLISNAVVHNENPSPSVKVEYLGAVEAGGHRYVVRDNGSGIPPEDLEKIFIPFFKGKDGDTGIGLATVEKVVTTYGGVIRAYNDDGACFEFVIRDYDSAS